MDTYRYEPVGASDHPGSLEGVTVIRVDCEDVDLGFEGDASLDGVVHLDTQGGNNAPSLVREGSELILFQRGRHRSGHTTTLRLPVEASPPITGRHEKGDLFIGDVYAEIEITLQSGDVRVNGGSGGIGLEVGKGDVQVHGFAGGVGLQVGSGDVQISRCAADIAVSLGKGDVQIDSCEGDVSLKCGSGDVMIGDTSGVLAIKLGSGDVLVARPRGQVVALKLGSGDVAIKNGSLTGMAIKVAKGDFMSSAHLVVSDRGTLASDQTQRGPREERRPGGDNPITRILKCKGVDLEIGDKGVRYAGVDLEFEASEAGVRISKGGKSFTADDSGVRIISNEDEPGGDFAAETGNGDVSIDIPNGAPIRVEALVSGGEVRSDVPLVSVGRPGPRGSTQRFVGVSDPNATARLNLRVKTDRGDIRIRRVAGVSVTPSTHEPSDWPVRSEQAIVTPYAPGASSGVDSSDAPTARVPGLRRDQQMRAVLDALARGEISVEEADRRLAGLDE